MQDILNLVSAHWEVIVLILTSCTVLFNALQKKAYGEFVKEALVMVKKVAVMELSNVEKRDAVIDSVYISVPSWVSSIITRDQAKLLVEQAYQVLKVDLKDEELKKTRAV